MAFFHRVVKEKLTQDRLAACYQVQIKDNGVGIAAEEQGKIFEPFYQGDISRTKQHSGLGLFVAKQILEKHSASIALEREPAYRTVFTIRFPPSKNCRTLHSAYSRTPSHIAYACHLCIYEEFQARWCC